MQRQLCIYLFMHALPPVILKAEKRNKITNPWQERSAEGKIWISIVKVSLSKRPHTSGADPGLTVGGGLSIPRALARAKFYVLRPLLTSFLRW